MRNVTRQVLTGLAFAASLAAMAALAGAMAASEGDPASTGPRPPVRSHVRSRTGLAGARRVGCCCHRTSPSCFE